MESSCSLSQIQVTAISLHRALLNSTDSLPPHIHHTLMGGHPEDIAETWAPSQIRGLDEKLDRRGAAMGSSVEAEMKGEPVRDKELNCRRWLSGFRQ